jgi:chromate reductase
VRRFKEALEEADAVLIATPEYNSSMPGVLKNALDWASRPVAESPVRGKPVAVLSASTGMFGAVWAAAETRKVMGALGARTLEETLALPKAHESVGVGFEPSELDALRNVVAELAAAVEARQALRSAA